MYLHQGDTVQIEAPEFDPDIDGDSPASTDEKHKIVPAQGTLATIPEASEPEDDNNIAPGTNTDQQNYQETDWPDAPPVQIPRVSSLKVQPPEQGHNRCQAQPSTENFKILELEENSEEEQFTDFDSFIAHHNTHQASEHIRQEYFSHVQDLDDNQYYTKIDRVDFSQCTPAAQDYQLASHQDLWKKSKEYLEGAEVKPDEKSYMATDHLAQELVLCKATFNSRSRRISVCMKGTLPTINISIL